MMTYRNTKVKVRCPDGDTDYFVIVAGVLLGDTLAPYHFIICLDCVLWTSIDKMKENALSWQRKEAEDAPNKQLRTPTTPMAYCFWKMHPLKPKPRYIVWNEQMQA